MSAALLRLAAEKIREEAGAATPGRWQPADSWAGSNAVLNGDGHPIAICGVDSPSVGYLRPSADRAHIAAWSPPVALAVADWLEATVRELVSLGDPDLSAHPQDGRRTAALKVARAYLGAEVQA